MRKVISDIHIFEATMWFNLLAKPILINSTGSKTPADEFLNTGTWKKQLCYVDAFGNLDKTLFRLIVLKALLVFHIQF